MRLVDHLLRRDRGFEETAQIGVGVEQAARYGVRHGLRHLRAGGIVEIDAPMPFIGQRKRRKSAAHGLDRKIRHCLHPLVFYVPGHGHGLPTRWWMASTAFCISSVQVTSTEDSAVSSWAMVVAPTMFAVTKGRLAT